MGLAVRTFHEKRKYSVRSLAKAFDVPKSTLQTRLHGTCSKLEVRSNQQKLQPSEEEALIKWIFDLDLRGFPLYIINIQEMVNVLLTARSPDTLLTIIDKTWLNCFITVHPQL